MTVDNSANDGPGGEGLIHRTEWTEFDRPSTAAVVAVGETTGRDPEDLPVLNEVVDGDALDAVVANSTGTVEVSFDYAGTVVRVSSSGELVVETFE